MTVPVHTIMGGVNQEIFPLAVTVLPIFTSEAPAGSTFTTVSYVLTITGGLPPYDTLWTDQTAEADLAMTITSPTATSTTFGGTVTGVGYFAAHMLATVTDALGTEATTTATVGVLKF